jgi:hypothetical protein
VLLLTRSDWHLKHKAALPSGPGGYPIALTHFPLALYLRLTHKWQSEVEVFGLHQWRGPTLCPALAHVSAPPNTRVSHTHNLAHSLLLLFSFLPFIFFPHL